MRTLSGSFETAINQSSLTAVLLLQLDLDTGTLRFNSSPINLDWGGYEWVGASTWGSVSSNKESMSGNVTGIVAELNGLPSTLISLALTEHVQGRFATMYFALLDSNYQFISDPVIEFKGLCDQLIIADSGDTSRVQLPIENRIIDFKRPVISRWNSTDHQIDHPNDTFFDYVETMVDKTIVWPNKEYFKK